MICSLNFLFHQLAFSKMSHNCLLFLWIFRGAVTEAILLQLQCCQITLAVRSFSICFGLHCSALLQILSIFFLLLLFILGLREPFCLLVLVHDRVASLLVCLLFQLFFFFSLTLSTNPSWRG